jgi:two-component system, LytTR family, response regulator
MIETKKVIICDDEDDARLLIRQYLAHYPPLEMVKECANGPEAVAAIDALCPDLVFLDIQMPGLNGFQVLQQIVHVPQIIFSTAFDNYALRAFDSNAVDYLLKPYTKERFAQAMQKVLAHGPQHRQALQQLNDYLQQGYNAHPDRVLVESGNRLVALPLDDIIWIAADGDYTRLHTAQRFYISSYGMNVLEQKLNPAQFMRIHRSAIVNLRQVRELQRSANGYTVVLQNGTVHKVGRSYVPQIKRIVW